MLSINNTIAKFGVRDSYILYNIAKYAKTNNIVAIPPIYGRHVERSSDGSSKYECSMSIPNIFVFPVIKP